MNYYKVFAVFAVLLSLCTYDVDGGITLLLLMKLIALKGALFLGAPLAFGAFLLGQGIGFLGGSVIGGYTVLGAANKYQKHQRIKAAKGVVTTKGTVVSSVLKATSGGWGWVAPKKQSLFTRLTKIPSTIIRRYKKKKHPAWVSHDAHGWHSAASSGWSSQPWAEDVQDGWGWGPEDTYANDWPAEGWADDGWDGGHGGYPVSGGSSSSGAKGYSSSFGGHGGYPVSGGSSSSSAGGYSSSPYGGHGGYPVSDGSSSSGAGGYSSSSGGHGGYPVSGGSSSSGAGGYSSSSGAGGYSSSSGGYSSGGPSSSSSSAGGYSSSGGASGGYSSKPSSGYGPPSRKRHSPPGSFYRPRPQHDDFYERRYGEATEEFSNMVPAPKNMIEEYLEKKLREEIKSAKSDSRKEEATQLMQMLREAYIQELASKIAAEKSEKKGEDSGPSTELPAFVRMPAPEDVPNSTTVKPAPLSLTTLKPPGKSPIQNPFTKDNSRFVPIMKTSFVMHKDAPQQVHENHKLTAQDTQALSTFKDDVKKFFLLVSFLDQDNCLQKLICDVHAKSSDKKSLSVYEKNIVTTFKVMNGVIADNVEDSTSPYRKAAKIGETSKNLQTCTISYSDCKYSTDQIIKMGNKLAGPKAETTTTTAKP